MIIGLRRSRLLSLAILLFLALAFVVLMATPFSWPIRAVGLFAAACVARFSWALLDPPVAAIKLGGQGEITVSRSGEGEFSPVVLLSGALVHPCLVSLLLKTEGGQKLRLIIAVDCLKPEDFRRLRVFMRWRAEFGELKDGV